MLPQELLDILCCPERTGELHYDEEAGMLSCLRCSRKFPVQNDIPILLPSADHEQRPPDR